MPFKEGTYRHEDGWTIYVSDGKIFISPDAPAFVNVKDFFNPEKWTRVVKEK